MNIEKLIIEGKSIAALKAAEELPYAEKRFWQRIILATDDEPQLQFSGGYRYAFDIE